MNEVIVTDDTNTLPVSFNLLTSIKIDKSISKSSFFYVNFFQGMSKVKIFSKPFSKSINWANFNNDET